MKYIQIDRKRRLRDEPGTGHNRFYPDLAPIVEVEEGEEVVLDTRDGVDGQLGPSTTEANIASMAAGAVHPLTGPVFVKGAQPGDVLEVEFLDISAQPHAFTAIVPGLGCVAGQPSSSHIALRWLPLSVECEESYSSLAPAP